MSPAGCMCHASKQLAYRSRHMQWDNWCDHGPQDERVRISELMDLIAIVSSSLWHL
jgi:hypothetical protein